MSSLYFHVACVRTQHYPDLYPEHVRTPIGTVSALRDFTSTQKLTAEIPSCMFAAVIIVIIIIVAQCL
jgi:hypothetical protein